MPWGYAMPKAGEEHWRVFGRKKSALQNDSAVVMPERSPGSLELLESVLHKTCSEAEIHHAPQRLPSHVSNGVVRDPEAGDKGDTTITQTPTQAVPISSRTKSETYSDLSIILTLISILVAFAVIEFMGIAPEKCGSCADAAENSSGLDGRKWRFWQACNDASGYIGARIGGVMVLCGALCLGLRRYCRRKARKLPQLARQSV